MDIVKKINRNELPVRLKIYDSNWNPGIMIGNLIIFTGKFKKETKKIKNVYRHNNDKHGFYVKYADEKRPIINLIYVRNKNV